MVDFSLEKTLDSSRVDALTSKPWRSSIEVKLFCAWAIAVLLLENEAFDVNK